MIYPEITMNKDTVADHYNDLDGIYRKIWGLHVHHGFFKHSQESADKAVLNLCDLVAQKLQIKEGQKICDIGCGYGGMSRYLVEQFRSETLGISVSAEQINTARTLSVNVDNPKYALGDWLENKLENESFDGAVAIECFTHMADKSRFFMQANRILKKGSKIVMCVWLGSDQAKKWEKKHLLVPICTEGRLPSMTNKEECIQMAEDNNFTLSDYSDISLQVSKTWSICIKRTLIAFFNDKELRNMILSSNNKIFALTVLRIWLAYRTGAMRYGMFVFEKN